MRPCSFCGAEITPGTGKMYVKTDAKIFYFCSTKCEKNMTDLGRKPRRMPWTKEHASLKQKKEVKKGK